MSITPFTLEDALEVAADFEDLIETSFRQEGFSWHIANVIVCPFNNPERGQYIKRFIESKIMKESEYQFWKTGFDVVVIIRAHLDSSVYEYIDIRSFAEKMGINYDFHK